MIEVKIIKDSINSEGNRITTWVLTYPRFIHSELMTHRAFSRNAASSRAIPIEKMIKAVEENPAMPEYWGVNQKGMQASTELTQDQIKEAKAAWLVARDSAVIEAKKLMAFGLHKQIVNRVLEPFMHMTIIMTATEYGNFFALRAHKDAQPEFQVLARCMLEAYNVNIPDQLLAGEWHIPFSDRMPEGTSQDVALKIASARCARVSYLTFDGKIDVQKDIELHDQLSSAGHMSPFEHCAQALPKVEGLSNFKGWLQYRAVFPNQNRSDPRIKTAS